MAGRAARRRRGRKRRRRSRRRRRDQGRVRSAAGVRRRTTTWRPRRPPAAPAHGGGKVQTEKSRATTTTKTNSSPRKSNACSKKSAHTVEGYYGIDAITHCCLEPHGSHGRVERRQADRLPFDAERLRHRRRLCQRPEHHGRRCRSPLRLHRRRLRQQVRPGLLGHRRGPHQQGDRPPGQVHARPRPGAEDRRQSPQRLSKVKLGADKDGIDHRLGFASTGARGGATPGGVSQTVDSVCVRAEELSPRGDEHQNQQRPSRVPGGRRTIRRPAPSRRPPCDDLAAKMGANSLDIFMKNLGTDDKPAASAGAKPSRL